VEAVPAGEVRQDIAGAKVVKAHRALLHRINHCITLFFEYTSRCTANKDDVDEHPSRRHSRLLWRCSRCCGACNNINSFFLE
jgi:hypothetical protein